MFTGLIEEIGMVVGMEVTREAGILTVAAGFPADLIAIGDSIAVNGACLTVVRKGAGTFSFDVSPETIARTSFNNLKKGTPVNLERALAVSGRLDGHLVSGHVDCLAVIRERRAVSGNTFLSFRMPGEYLKYVAAKGSIAIEGISLTVNTVDEEGFTVNIIPHTLQKTTLEGKKVGDVVNIETDILAKYVERLLSRRDTGNSPGISLELLAKSGFM
ncbi:riboflavin synthase [Geotalea sp. SG265]|uniref:riboflavin synthase n=1 Tax=Geotalea sp. SG265 TaxID=2922867 RepID=UPI001FAEA6C3|nr:riboflavin synthase [Geotalea sp. SG265]